MENLHPLTSLDVCGHEIGHGVCEFTADLVLENLEQ
jgi:Zn-dependent metalloprotease